MSAPHPAILLAPVLKAEHWTSIDLLRENYRDSFRAHAPEWEVHDITPGERLASLPLGKRVLRDIVYPVQAAASARHYERLGRRPVLHVIDHSYGHLCSTWKRSVITCNDLNHFTYPTMRGPALWAWRLRASRMKDAARVVCISAQLASEVHEHLQIPMERITVAHYGIDRVMFRKRTASECEQAFPELAKLAKTHSLIVNIGSNLQRKNLATTLRALALLKHDRKMPVKLLKIGHSLISDGYGPLMDELDVADDVINLGALTSDQVACVCSLSHALSFPSLYEGFGRPTLEAQACELPTVLSRASCMAEIGGEGALYHEGTNHEELAGELEKALTHSNVRTLLIAAGLKNVDRFTWQAHIRKLTSVYEEVAAV
jgi:glycosyltransferase involved in cell wall biosynthesis